MNYWGKHFTFSVFNAGSTGTKQFGSTLWGHSRRFGLQINLWRWELQLMWERS